MDIECYIQIPQHFRAEQISALDMDWHNSSRTLNDHWNNSKKTQRNSIESSGGVEKIKKQVSFRD
jgi:hypothetical protein